MGLHTELDISGLPQELTNELYGITVEVDYTEAINTFIDTFMEVATSLCPVDTGYLCSTIDAGGDESSLYAEASAEYAEYVEYGTSRMGAQPFFDPAVEIATGAFNIMAEQALNEAQQEAQELIEAAAASENEDYASGGGGFGGAMGNIIGAVLVQTIAFLIGDTMKKHPKHKK